MLKWGNLHRESCQKVRGRVRQFIADMALLTFSNPDEGYRALLELRTLVGIHNTQSTSGLPPFSFKAALCYGDLILSPTGVVGALVNETFDVLEFTPREGVCLSKEAYDHLREYQEHFVPLDDASDLYVLQES